MIKHRAFNVDRFVDQFGSGGEWLLRGFVKLWGRKGRSQGELG